MTVNLTMPEQRNMILARKRKLLPKWCLATARQRSLAINGVHCFTGSGIHTAAALDATWHVTQNGTREAPPASQYIVGVASAEVLNIIVTHIIHILGAGALTPCAIPSLLLFCCSQPQQLNARQHARVLSLGSAVRHNPSDNL